MRRFHKSIVGPTSFRFKPFKHGWRSQWINRLKFFCAATRTLCSFPMETTVWPIRRKVLKISCYLEQEILNLAKIKIKNPWHSNKYYNINSMNINFKKEKRRKGQKENTIDTC